MTYPLNRKSKQWSDEVLIKRKFLAVSKIQKTSLFLCVMTVVYLFLFLFNASCKLLIFVLKFDYTTWLFELHNLHTNLCDVVALIFCLCACVIVCGWNQLLLHLSTTFSFTVFITIFRIRWLKRKRKKNVFYYQYFCRKIVKICIENQINSK